VNILSEGQVCSKEGWINELSLSQAAFEQMELDGCFERRNNDFALNYVGLGTIEGATFFSRPKFQSNSLPRNDDALEANVSWLDGVLQRYEENSRRRQLSNEAEEARREAPAQRWNAYAIYKSALRYFRESGAYMPAPRYFLSSDPGQIDWGATVARCAAMHSFNGTIYPNPIGYVPASRTNDITFVHLSCLDDLHSRFSLIPRDLSEQLKADMRQAGFSSLLPVDYLRSQLAAEIASTFTDERLDLLIALDRWLAADRSADLGVWTPHLGTHAFHLVWEDACRTVFSIEGEKILLARAVWQLSDRSIPAADLRPDFCILERERRFTLDAKYYYPFPKNVCGLADINKQLIYSLASSAYGKQATPVFLFPGEARRSEFLKLEGCVEMMVEKCSHPAFPKIYVISIEPMLLFQAYVLRLSRRRELLNVLPTSFNFPNH
jgi:LlaJI restriction endonuclease